MRPAVATSCIYNATAHEAKRFFPFFATQHPQDETLRPCSAVQPLVSPLSGDEVPKSFRDTDRFRWQPPVPSLRLLEEPHHALNRHGGFDRRHGDCCAGAGWGEARPDNMCVAPIFPRSSLSILYCTLTMSSVKFPRWFSRPLVTPARAEYHIACPPPLQIPPKGGDRYASQEKGQEGRQEEQEEVVVPCLPFSCRSWV
jgi:hypothetical protein